MFKFFFKDINIENLDSSILNSFLNDPIQDLSGCLVNCSNRGGCTVNDLGKIGCACIENFSGPLCNIGKQFEYM